MFWKANWLHNYIRKDTTRFDCLCVWDKRVKTQTKDIRMVVPTFSILILPESPGIQEMIFLGHKDNETCIPHQLLCSSDRAAVDVQLPSNLPLPANIILVSVSFRFSSRWEAGPEYDIWDIKEKFGTGKVLEWIRIRCRWLWSQSRPSRGKSFIRKKSP